MFSLLSLAFVTKKISEKKAKCTLKSYRLRLLTFFFIQWEYYLEPNMTAHFCNSSTREAMEREFRGSLVYSLSYRQTKAT